VRSFHLHITGQVQGVGFRPFVYVTALENQVRGWVKNTIDGVHVQFNAENLVEAEKIRGLIIQHAPPLSIITNHELTETDHLEYSEFSIVQSDEEGKANLLLTPDFAMCPDCKHELLSLKDRRSHYPFITCTNCGPRYSIIKELPYDRPYTTMSSFEMCHICDEEYHNPLDRRYYSQTNSCGDCAVKMSGYLSDATLLPLSNADKQIDFIVDKLKEGAIIAVKGIGGFLLIADALDKKVVQKLRQRKNRPSKAFAMMFPDLESIASELELHDKAREMLQGPVAPIILLRKKARESRYAYQEIAPGLDKIGVMIPYAPLYELILNQLGTAIIATSGNLTNEPIVFDNQTAMDRLGAIADYIVTNNRDIVAPQDDSVINYTEQKRIPIIYRRSRGLAPTYLDRALKFPDQCILATGAELKSSFSLLFNRLSFVSQYLGDLEDYATQMAYQHTLNHFLSLFKARPDLILHDLHPGYFSTQLAKEMSSDLKIEKRAIQHHEAHFAAIMGEHKLFDEGKALLGCIWDGTGYGSDGQIWGGEFFMFRKAHFTRVGHLTYYDFILGDKMPREPRISALAIGSKIEALADLLEKKFTPTEWQVYQNLLATPSPLKSSSMGRLFDAVASIVLDIDKCSYEGEAAMFLEVSARQHFESKGKICPPFHLSLDEHGNLDTKVLLKDLALAKLEGKSEGELALGFHCILVQWVEEMLRAQGIDQVAFSGGVFQNALLVDLMTMRLDKKCKLYFHQRLSPNDECISFGQLMYHVNGIRSQNNL
jgi:hydrogenase maturation protein HypF